ncbi:hypothetical protein FKP32DRAFT_1587528 [Trametes sanguinea]|nr:hypothetical protein FKP32DRAFT_1587528 [Trametes sanguinea]
MGDFVDDPHAFWQGTSTPSAITPHKRSITRGKATHSLGTSAPSSFNNSAPRPNTLALSERISFGGHVAEHAMPRLPLDAFVSPASSSSIVSGGSAPSATFDARERHGSLSSDGYSPVFCHLDLSVHIIPACQPPRAR